MTESWRKLWAKSHPHYYLWRHLLDAAAVSLALRNPLADDGWSAEQVALLVGLHDIGKADPCFQHQGQLNDDELAGLEREQQAWEALHSSTTLPPWRLPAEVKRRVRSIAAARAAATAKAAGFKPGTLSRYRHERVSAKFVEKQALPEYADFIYRSAIARAVVVHHGYWNESCPWPPPDTYGRAQEELLNMLRGAIGCEELPKAATTNLSAFGMRLAGHVVLCDWIASNEEFLTDERLANIDDPGGYFAKARQVATGWISNLGLQRAADGGRPYDIVNAPRPIQQAILDNDLPPGLVIIEAPMGEGKTEAAWILAEKWRAHGYNGTYMALPTMATSDMLHGRYRDDYLRPHHPREDTKLIHGMAWLRDDIEFEPNAGEPGEDRTLAAAWFRPTRRAMLAAHGVGTVDQAMLAGMNVKFGFLRLYGLDSRVLVIDEVHAYDAYMSAIIGRLLAWGACMRIPVIMLSATLAARQRQAMVEAYGGTLPDEGDATNVPYPLVTVAPLKDPAFRIDTVKDKDGTESPLQASRPRTLEIRPETGLLGDAKKTAKLADSLVKDRGCCCVILNTVKQAQEVYKALPHDTPKLLFHSRFTAADRTRITEHVWDLFGKRKVEAAQRPAKFVLVATQVVEQSLDVDFDHMISEIAPMDLLLQRSGRIKRHARTKDGRLKDSGEDERGKPVLHVLLPKEEAGKSPKFGSFENRVYQRYPLLTTLALIGQERKVKLPDEFRTLIEATYADDLAAASKDLNDAKDAWDELQEEMAAQAGEFLLCEPMIDEFDPVGHDEVGDDSDDGNGWRGRTRLGLEDVMVIPVADGNAAELAKGDLPRDVVKALYHQSVKLPGWRWPLRPEPLRGEQKLRGVWLLPVKGSVAKWTWTGDYKDEKGNWKAIEFSYDKETGLTETEKKDSKAQEASQ